MGQLQQRWPRSRQPRTADGTAEAELFQDEHLWQAPCASAAAQARGAEGPPRLTVIGSSPGSRLRNRTTPLVSSSASAQ